MTEGHYDSHATDPANMTGFSYDTFNERGTDEAYLDAALKWSAAQIPTIPGAGIAYTREDLDRSQFAFLDQLPVRFPKDDGIPTFFLAAQAGKPVKGNAWGLLLQYNCSIIQQAKDFQVVDKVHSSDSPWLETDSPLSDNTRLLKDKKSVLAWFNQMDGSWTSNFQAAIDVGFQLARPSEYGSAMDVFNGLDNKDCYLNMEMIPPSTPESTKSRSSRSRYGKGCGRAKLPKTFRSHPNASSTTILRSTMAGTMCETTWG